MSTGSELAITAEQTYFSDKQLAALTQLGVAGAGRADLAVFFHQVARTGLDPFARQIYMIERQGKQTIQTGIDGFRLIARRAVDQRNETLGYQDTLWCGADGQWVDVWLKTEHPAAAKTVVLRNGCPFPAVALWGEYVAVKRDGSVTAMWASKGALMLAKCSEALALRKAFPQDLSGLYTSDEMQQSDNGRRAPAVSDDGGPAPVVDALVVLRTEIKQLGEARGLTVGEIGDDFAQWAQGVMVPDADADLLTRYRDYLQALPSVEQATP